MASENGNSREGDRATEAKRLRAVFGPQKVDSHIRNAIQFCWLAMPCELQCVDEVEKTIRQSVENALRDLRVNYERFGIGSSQGDVSTSP
jgi:hypothetical protein